LTLPSPAVFHRPPPLPIRIHRTSPSGPHHPPETPLPPHCLHLEVRRILVVFVVGHLRRHLGRRWAGAGAVGGVVSPGEGSEEDRHDGWTRFSKVPEDCCWTGKECSACDCRMSVVGRSAVMKKIGSGSATETGLTSRYGERPDPVQSLPSKDGLCLPLPVCLAPVPSTIHWRQEGPSSFR